MDLTTFAPKLSVDIDLFEELLTNRQNAMAKLSSSDQFVNILQKAQSIDIKSILPSLNLNEFTKPPQLDPLLENSYAFKNPHSRPIHTLPKSVDDFKNVFPNFQPPEKTSIVPAISSLESRRPLHEETKKELSPVEKMLDENFKAMHSTIQQALSAARSARIQVEDKLLSGPIHPYQKLIYQYLGSDFIAPSIHDIPLPQNFCPVQCNKELTKITDNIFKNTMTQFQHLTAGIGKIENEDERKMMEGLGHAFSTLSATPDGVMFVIDHKKTADYLEFAEMVRNIPIKEIVTNPVQTAQKVITRMIQVLSPLATNNIIEVEDVTEISKDTNNATEDNKQLHEPAFEESTFSNVPANIDSKGI